MKTNNNTMRIDFNAIELVVSILLIWCLGLPILTILKVIFTIYFVLDSFAVIPGLIIKFKEIE
jgi:hypothetical protein